MSDIYFEDLSLVKTSGFTSSNLTAVYARANACACVLATVFV